MTPAADLVATWLRRDESYRLRKYLGVPHRLSQNEADAIREWREKEARALTGNERLIALAACDRWTPPL